MSKSSMINHYSPSTVIASPIHGQSWCNYTTPTHHYLADVLKTTSQCWWRRKKFLPEEQVHSLVLSGSGNCLKEIYIYIFSGGDMVSSPESPIRISPLLFLWCEHAHLHFGKWLSQESSGPSLEFFCLFVSFFFCWGPISPASSLLHGNGDDPDLFPHQEPSSAQQDTLRQHLS